MGRIEPIETVIVGAGQAGLATSFHLGRQGREHVVLERAPTVGHVWSDERWDSFTAVTPNWSLDLPGHPYIGDEPDGYLARADLVRYFEDYAATIRAPIEFGVTVQSIAADTRGDRFIVTTTDRSFAAANVVVATGLHQRPARPDCADRVPPSIEQLHSSQYRNPDALPPGAVLVVGSAQSGAQIAEDLYFAGRQVYLSVGNAGRAPRRYRGRDVFWWLLQVGFFDQPIDTTFSPPHVSGVGGGRTLNLHQFARDGVRLLGHVRDVTDDRLHLAPDLHESLAKADAFATQAKAMIDAFIAKSGMHAPQASEEANPTDGFTLDPLTELDLTATGIGSIVWATGYGHEFGLVRFPLFRDDGLPLPAAEIPVPGLFFVGVHTLKATTIVGSGHDAARVAAAITARSGSEHRAERVTAIGSPTTMAGAVS